MYYVFKDNIIEQNGKILHAKLINDTRDSVPDYYQNLVYAKPLEIPLIDMTFLVSNKIVALDNLYNGAMLAIYSEKLIRLIEEEKISHQKFKISLIDERTKLELNRKYYIFHLTYAFDGIDKDASDMDELSIRTIELTRKCLETQPLLFRDSTQKNLVFIHTRLKEKFDNHNIAGCEYIHYTDYQHLFGAGQPNRKSASFK